MYLIYYFFRNNLPNFYIELIPFIDHNNYINNHFNLVILFFNLDILFYI